MNVVAYCAQSFRDSVAQAAGTEPMCSPPYTMATFDPSALQTATLVYVKLHGLVNQPWWYGDGYVTALSADQVRALDLSATTLFVANCHSFTLVEHKPQLGPMVTACLQAGARAVICGPGQNLARRHSVDGCDLLGRHIRILHNARFPPGLAFRLARARLALSNRQDTALTDSLAFRIFTRSTP